MSRTCLLFKNSITSRYAFSLEITLLTFLKLHICWPVFLWWCLWAGMHLRANKFQQSSQPSYQVKVGKAPQDQCPPSRARSDCDLWCPSVNAPSSKYPLNRLSSRSQTSPRKRQRPKWDTYRRNTHNNMYKQQTLQEMGRDTAPWEWFRLGTGRCKFGARDEHESRERSGPLHLRRRRSIVILGVVRATRTQSMTGPGYGGIPRERSDFGCLADTDTQNADMLFYGQKACTA